MEIVDAQCAVLTDHEAYIILQEATRIPTWKQFECALKLTKVNQKRNSPSNQQDEDGQSVDDVKQLRSELGVHHSKAKLRNSMLSGRHTLRQLAPVASTVFVHSSAIDYLESHAASIQTKRMVSEFMKELRELLTAERIQLTLQEIQLLINLVPSLPVELHSIIDESEERINETQVTKVLELVSKWLPKGSKKDFLTNNETKVENNNATTTIASPTLHSPRIQSPRIPHQQIGSPPSASLSSSSSVPLSFPAVSDESAVDESAMDVESDEGKNVKAKGKRGRGRGRKR